MGCDIHWVIERFHPKTKTWEAVLSEDSEAYDQIPPGGTDPKWDFSRPAERLSGREYKLFGLLSGVRTNQGGETLMTDGLPDDPSCHACGVMEIEHGGSDLHSHGWAFLSVLKTAAQGELPDGCPTDDETRQCLKAWVQGIEDTLAYAGPDGPTRILRGRGIDTDTGQYLPDMGLLSNHEKLALDEMGRSFGPLRVDYIRVIVAYDN
jgi:hypothetical protein